MTSIRARLHVDWRSLRPSPGTRIRPFFALGLVTIAVVMIALVLRPAGASGDVSAATASPSSAAVTPAGSLASVDPGSSPSDSSSSSSIVPTDSPSSLYTRLPGYVWPLPNGKVTLPLVPTSYGEFFRDGVRIHDGLDMATACGDRVHAAHDGVVLAASRHFDDFVGWVGDLAPYYQLLDSKRWWNSLPIVIVIDDGNGYRSIYAHESSVTVSPGQHVTAGQVIGYEGATGNATGCHVHYGLFSLTETATFQLDPAIAKRMLLPAAEIARTDPLLILPFRCDVEEMLALRPFEARACPVIPTAVPAAKPTAKPAPTTKPSVAPSVVPTPVTSPAASS